jgi:hypothetical protein
LHTKLPPHLRLEKLLDLDAISTGVLEVEATNLDVLAVPQFGQQRYTFKAFCF